MSAVSDLPSLPLDQWLTAKELAARLGVSPQSVHRWRDEGAIPEGLWRRCGFKLVYFRPESVAWLQERFDEAHA